MIDLVSTIQNMEVCGMSAEQIVMALKCLTAQNPVVDDQAERRRAADRDRKAADRERKSAECLRNSAENDDKKKIPHTPLRKILPINYQPTREAVLEGDVVPSVSRGTRLPENFVPLPSVLIGGENIGLTKPEIDDQLQRFRDWALAATGKVAIKRDWNAAFRNWLRRASDEKKKSNARTANRNNSKISNAFADLRADLEGGRG